MICREDVISILRSSFNDLHTDYGVAKIGVFGSFARGNPGSDSDLDLVIEFEKPIGLRFMELADRLQSLFKRPVDILTPAGIDGIRNKEVADTIRRTVLYV
jgi:uncharacterized protein